MAKSTIRISLSESMKAGVSFLQKTRYPFLKEDEIFKLAFSRLYSSEYDGFVDKSVGYIVLEAIREKHPDFAKEWSEENEMSEKSLDLTQLIDIIREKL